ncbi:MAG: hypothetical protein LBV23_10380, partial [Deltaproteobacteria bacterium]|nr:hypothetical protein [Deltaproteobacteria bacterium]
LHCLFRPHLVGELKGICDSFGCQWALCMHDLLYYLEKRVDERTEALSLPERQSAWGRIWK